MKKWIAPKRNWKGIQFESLRRLVDTFAKNDLFMINVDVSTAESAVADVILFVRGKQKVA